MERVCIRNTMVCVLNPREESIHTRERLSRIDQLLESLMRQIDGDINILHSTDEFTKKILATLEPETGKNDGHIDF